MKPMTAATLAVLVASVIGQCVGAGQSSVGLSIFAAAAFSGAVLRLAWHINTPWWRSSGAALGPSHAQALPLMASRNALMLALGYAWGGLSMLAVYLLTPLRWQHGWQYGAGMVVIGALIWWVSRRLSVSAWTRAMSQRLTWLTLAHGSAATAALGWLILSGKLATTKADWAANIVFVCGALIITGVSAMGLRTLQMLEK